MKILALETSCDDTAAAVVENGTRVLSYVRNTQTDHAEWGGVVPEIAARRHSQNWSAVIKAALAEANMQPHELDALAVTQGPGMQSSLLVGTTAMNTLSLEWNKPLIAVPHVWGHVVSPMLDRAQSDFRFPALCLTVSGGHTMLVRVTSWTTGELLGQTLDDAAGEAFDKVARMLGLSYPGGPEISRVAEMGDKKKIHFPRILLEKKSLDFSFSGLKASAYRLTESTPEDEKTEQWVADVAASFQWCVTETLWKKTARALQMHPDTKGVWLAGGVSANTQLRECFTQKCDAAGYQFFTPTQLRYCTDNAAMIGAAAYCIAQEKPLAQHFVLANPKLGLLP